MRKIIAAALIAAAAIAPSVASAHDYVSASACASDAGLSNDCVRVDTDTEFEDGVLITLDGDDTDPRDDGTTDGYVTIGIDGSGAVSVYCEDEGGYNHISDRTGGDEDDANGDNENCEP